jgi:hypothetical protein
MNLTRTLLGLSVANLLACSSCGGASNNPAPVTPPPSSSVDFASAPPAMASPKGSSAGVYSGTPAPTGPCAASPPHKTYDVGDDKPYKTFGAVPWNLVGTGDAVRVFWRPQPYHEKIAINGSGTEKSPLRICGMANAKGEKPIIDGENAVTAKGSSFNHAVHERRGIISVTAAKTANDTEQERKPHHVIIEGFEIRNTGDMYKFTDTAGASQSYFDNGAGIYIERGEDIIIRNNDVHHCANGVFVQSGGGEDVVSRRITIESNYLHDNGSTGSRRDRHHNAYTEALGIVYQFNRFGPIRQGSEGIQLKDRSTGNVIRYNWFEGGKRVMDLVEPEESYEMARKDPNHNNTYVYGNTIVLGKDASSRMIHYGGDNGDSRKGTMYFYDNTVVIHTSSKEQWNISLFQLETQDETADVRNNIFVQTSDANLWWVYYPGTVKLGTNWFTGNVKLVREAGGPAKLEHIYGSDKTIRGAAPGFVNMQAGDFCLAKGAPARGVGGEPAQLPSELAPTLQYKKHLEQAPRPANKDLGAFVCD